MAIRLWGSKTPGNAQDSRDVTLMRNKKRVCTHIISRINKFVYVHEGAIATAPAVAKRKFSQWIFTFELLYWLYHQ